MARRSVDDSGRADSARRLDRHRRDFAASCSALGQDRILAGGIALGLAGAVGSELCRALAIVLLALFQLGGFAVCAWLFASRDRTTLMASENRSIGRLAVGAVLVIPFIVTDFRVLMPDIPVRLGALGALLVVTAILIQNTVPRRSVRRFC